MNRRELFAALVAAPLIKPLAKLLPAKAAPVVGRYAGWSRLGVPLTQEDMEYCHGFESAMVRNFNATIEDELMLGYPPEHHNCRCGDVITAVYEGGVELDEVVEGSVNIPTIGIR